MSMHRPVNPFPPEPYPSSAAKPVEREWRVGSLSMGITLILIGTAFAVSIWQDAEAYELLLWVAPVVFILLGVELLIYLKSSGKTDTVIRYDWLSVFFVGLLGLGSLVLSLLMSSGIYDEIQRELNMTARTAYVESGKVEVPKEIKTIVVQSSIPVSVEDAETKAIQLIGQIKYWSTEAMTDRGGLLHTNIVGSTMYVFVDSPDVKSGGLSSESLHSGLILTIPKDIALERRPY